LSGHSKWSTIKRKKGAADAKRGALFGKLSKAITVAAREGGGDTEMNPALALAVQKAKDGNMPNDNIQRAIDKGTGSGADAAAIERITYEGYAPGGVAVLVDALTDNRNRTASDVRYVFSKNGGKLGTSGSVAYLFEEFAAVRGVLDEAGIAYENAEITMEPQNSIDLDASTARQTLRLIDALEENDDIQEVYANFDISDEVMAEVAS
jgi:transcriptional/translational regulatory protein YebC/TACO1